MHLLECIVAVLSLGALCKENGYTCMWKNGQTPSLIKGNLEVECQPRSNVPFIFIVEGNLNPALSGEDAMIEEMLEEIDPPPAPDESCHRPKSKERAVAGETKRFTSILQAKSVYIILGAIFTRTKIAPYVTM